jgi:hypothetical protein
VRETDAQHGPVSRIKERESNSQHDCNCSQPSHRSLLISQSVRVDREHSVLDVATGFGADAGRGAIGNIIFSTTIGLLITA